MVVAPESTPDVTEHALLKRTQTERARLQDRNEGPRSMPNTLRSANAIGMSMKLYGCEGAPPRAGAGDGAAAGAPAPVGLRECQP